MEKNIDGFYTAMFSGTDGNGLGMFVFRNGRIVGSDAAGVVFDGNFHLQEDKHEYAITVSVKAPPGGYLIQGVPTGEHGITYELKASLPEDFEKAPYLSIQTPFGPVNIKIEKVAELSL